MNKYSDITSQFMAINRWSRLSFTSRFILRDPIVNISISSFLSLFYLIIFVTIGGMSLWMMLVRKSGAATASSYHLINSFFGAILSYFVLGSPLHASDFTGATLISIGLLLTRQTQPENPQ